MKKAFQSLLQRIFGFDNYLFLFSLFKIYTLRWDGPNKEGDFNHFLTLLKSTDHVLDIGANIGIMSALIARQCKQGQVFAFEPIPENLKALKRIIRFLRIHHVQIFSVALGAESKRIHMQMPLQKGVRMQGLSHVSHPSIEAYDLTWKHYELEQISLDEIEILKKVPVHAIKMDVENYEQFVIEGGQGMLAKNMPIIYCELWDNENRRRCFELLADLGYAIFVFDNKQLVPFEQENHSHHNFFFLPSERIREFI